MSEEKKNNKKNNIRKNGGKNEENEKLNIEDIFSLADLYFKEKFIMYSHNYNSFVDFLNVKLRNFLEKGEHIIYEKIINNEIHVFKFKFNNIRISLPQRDKTNILFPDEARENNLTYASNLLADVIQIQEIQDITTLQVKEIRTNGEDKNVIIAKIPIMVNSYYCSLQRLKDRVEKLNKECNYDPGCYFIINGNEKVIIPQETKVYNKPVCYKKNNNVDTLSMQIMCQDPYHDDIKQALKLNLKQTGEITIQIPVLEEFPAIFLFKLYGNLNDKDIIDYICYDKNNIEMMSILSQALQISRNNYGIKLNEPDEIKNILINKMKIKKEYSNDPNIQIQQKKAYLDHLLNKTLLPHITGGMKNKLLYLGYMINKLINIFIGVLEPDDRDSFINKRVKLVGDLLFEQFVTQFKRMLYKCKNKFDSRNKNSNLQNNPMLIINEIRSSDIERGLNQALATGAFGKDKGVSQALQRNTYMLETLSLRRINSPTSETNQAKLFDPRMYHTSSVGMLCPIETPEHASVGFIKHLSLIGNITIDNSDKNQLVLDALKNKMIPLDKIIPSEIGNNTKIFLNGCWLGITDKPFDVFTYLKNKKYNLEFPPNISISYNNIMNELDIWTDGGRLFRPVLRVNDNKLFLKKKDLENIYNDNMTWKQFMVEHPGVIEYIDCDEQFNALIAPSIDDVYKQKQLEEETKLLSKDGRVDNNNRYNDLIFKSYSYSEIHPTLLLGSLASTIPFINHDNCSRLTLHYAQGKQAMCVYASNYRYRMDNANMLYHPQKPLIDTRTSKYTYYDILSPGENVIIAVMCYTGFNQEDSIIMNKSSIERGLFASTTYEKKISTLGKNQMLSQDDKFIKPDLTKTSNTLGNNYDKLNDQGYVPEETVIENNDVIIGKVSAVQTNGDPNIKPYKDASEVYKHYLPATIDKVLNDIKNSENCEIKKVRIRSERIPFIGDKFSTKAAQKGTIGLILPAADMPVTENGITPDIIFNPSSIYGRMTVGFLFEGLFGKAGAIKGCEYDATGFIERDPENIEKVLKDYGFDEHGLETMYNGMTGEKMQVKIFVCPMYYLRLTHLVANKVHARATGPKSTLERQPVEGRKRGGGLRIGEMERDVLISHGASKYLKEKLLDVSDKYECYVCGKCGLIASRLKNIQSQNVNPSHNDIYYCRVCENNIHIKKVIIPYAFKLLCQELMSMSVIPKFKLNENDEIIGVEEYVNN